MAQQNPSPLDTSRPGIVSPSDVDKETSSARRKGTEHEELRGDNVKKARGIRSEPSGHNEAGTDQKVEDSRRLNHGKEKR